MTSEALNLPQSADIPFDAIQDGAVVNDVLTWDGINWSSQAPTGGSGGTLTYATPLLVMPPGIINSRAYRAMVVQNGNLVSLTGAVTIAYNGALDSSFLLTLPIPTTNWIPGFNQFNGIATGPGVQITITQNALTDTLEFHVVDSTNVSVKYLHIHYNVSYLISVPVGLDDILTAPPDLIDFSIVTQQPIPLELSNAGSAADYHDYDNAGLAFPRAFNYLAYAHRDAALAHPVDKFPVDKRHRQIDVFKHNTITDQFDLHSWLPESALEAYPSANYTSSITGTFQDFDATTLMVLDPTDAVGESNYVGDTIVILAGTGTGESRIIHDNSAFAKIIKVTAPWVTPLDITSSYEIHRLGTAQAGAAISITLEATDPKPTSFYDGKIIEIIAGTGTGEIQTISTYDGNTKMALLLAPWGTIPDNTSVYKITINTGFAQTYPGHTQWFFLEPADAGVTDFIANRICEISTGSGSGQTQTITSYNANLNLAIVIGGWAPLPDNTSTYNIYILNGYSILQFMRINENGLLLLDIRRSVSGVQGTENEAFVIDMRTAGARSAADAVRIHSGYADNNNLTQWVANTSNKVLVNTPTSNSGVPLGEKDITIWNFDNFAVPFSTSLVALGVDMTPIAATFNPFIAGYSDGANNEGLIIGHDNPDANSYPLDSLVAAPVFPTLLTPIGAGYRRFTAPIGTPNIYGAYPAALETITNNPIDSPKIVELKITNFAAPLLGTASIKLHLMKADGSKYAYVGVQKTPTQTSAVYSTHLFGAPIYDNNVNDIVSLAICTHPVEGGIGLAYHQISQANTSVNVFDPDTYMVAVTLEYDNALPEPVDFELVTSATNIITTSFTPAGQIKDLGGNDYPDNTTDLKITEIRTADNWNTITQTINESIDDTVVYFQTDSPLSLVQLRGALDFNTIPATYAVEVFFRSSNASQFDDSQKITIDPVFTDGVDNYFGFLPVTIALDRYLIMGGFQQIAGFPMFDNTHPQKWIIYDLDSLSYTITDTTIDTIQNVADPPDPVRNALFISASKTLDAQNRLGLVLSSFTQAIPHIRVQYLKTNPL